MEADEHANYVYSAPITTLKSSRAMWDKLTGGLSPEELTDFEKAKETLELYERVYDIFEYSTELNEHIQVLELKITSNNPTIPMNVYR